MYLISSAISGLNGTVGLSSGLSSVFIQCQAVLTNSCGTKYGCTANRHTYDESTAFVSLEGTTQAEADDVARQNIPFDPFPLG